MCGCKGSKYKNEDFCGPQVTNWWTWSISALVPDNLWGIYIGDLCQLHDAGYTDGGYEEDRLACDQDFRDAVRARLTLELKDNGRRNVAMRAWAASQIYYIGVRQGGAKQFNYDKEST